MALVKIAYVSMTGNTEEISEILEDKFTEAGMDVVRETGDSIDEDFFSDADICVVATHSEGAGDVPMDFEDFQESLEDQDLSGKVFGVVCSGDIENYEDTFCGAGDTFEKSFEQTGANKGHDIVKIDNNAEGDDIIALETFAKDLIAAAE